jgi:arylsulfatase A-like enzyme
MADATPPNVLLIVMDDQRADYLGYAGNPEVVSPRLDELAAAGVVFENCFVTTPICTPGRAELYTGCSTDENEVPWFDTPICPDLELLPGPFARAGYETAFFGKWHNDGHPRDRGFAFTDRVMFDARDVYRRYAEHGHQLIFDEPDGPVEGHSTDLFTDAALRWLDRRPGPGPWCAVVAYHSPHDPFQPPEPYRSMFPPEDERVPAAFANVHPVDTGDLAIRDEQNLPWPRMPEAIREYQALYKGMIAHHDAAIGRILDHLRERGELKDTIVVFTSDHGLAVGSHGLLGKANMLDHTVRVPLLVAGPGIAAGRRVPGMVRITDVFPTVCGLAGLDIPETVGDGRDLSSFLRRGQDAPTRSEVYGQFSSPVPRDGVSGRLPLQPTQRMIRTDDAKLVFYPGIRLYRYFDLREDPDETVDLLAGWLHREYWWIREREDARHFAPDPASTAALGRAEELRRRLHEHLVAIGDDAAAAVAEIPIGATA